MSTFAMARVSYNWPAEYRRLNTTSFLRVDVRRPFPSTVSILVPWVHCWRTHSFGQPVEAAGAVCLASHLLLAAGMEFSGRLFVSCWGSPDLLQYEIVCVNQGYYYVSVSSVLVS